MLVVLVLIHSCNFGLGHTPYSSTHGFSYGNSEPPRRAYRLNNPNCYLITHSRKHMCGFHPVKSFPISVPRDTHAQFAIHAHLWNRLLMVLGRK
jgi:hypothetical protein